MDTITIEGTTAWCNPFEPNKQFVKPHGVYDAAINVDAERAAKLCEYLDGLAEQKLAQVIKEAPENKRKQLENSLSIAPSGSPSLKDGVETGETLFKTKLQAVVEKKDGTSYTQKPVVFDARLTPITNPIKITAGSTVKLVVEPYPYVMMSTKTVGVSLRLWKLQIINLKESKDDTDGLEVVDGGFVASAIAKDDKQETNFEDDYAKSSQESANDERDF
jgi:hypothetical protein